MSEAAKFLIVNTETITGKKIIENKGYVKGNVIQARHLGKDILASLKTIVGGEIKVYTELMSDARKTAVKRMVDDATAKGANAVVNIRFSTAQVAPGSAEILAYGTAVVVEDE